MILHPPPVHCDSHTERFVPEPGQAGTREGSSYSLWGEILSRRGGKEPDTSDTGEKRGEREGEGEGEGKRMEHHKEDILHTDRKPGTLPGQEETWRKEILGDGEGCKR